MTAERTEAERQWLADLKKSIDDHEWYANSPKRDWLPCLKEAIRQIEERDAATREAVALREETKGLHRVLDAARDVRDWLTRNNMRTTAHGQHLVAVICDYENDMARRAQPASASMAPGPVLPTSAIDVQMPHGATVPPQSTSADGVVRAREALVGLTLMSPPPSPQHGPILDRDGAAYAAGFAAALAMLREPDKKTIDEITHVLSEWLNNDAPLGEARYRHPGMAALRAAASALSDIAEKEGDCPD